MFKARVQGLFQRHEAAAADWRGNTDVPEAAGRPIELKECLPTSRSDDAFESQLDALDRAFAEGVFPAEPAAESASPPLRAWDDDLRADRDAFQWHAAPAVVESIPAAADRVEPEPSGPGQEIGAAPAVAEEPWAAATPDELPAPVMPAIAPAVQYAEVLAPAEEAATVPVRGRLQAHRARLVASFRAILAAEQAERDAAGLGPLVSEPAPLSPPGGRLGWTAPSVSTPALHLNAAASAQTTRTTIAILPHRST
jgi:hypothetical protein